MMKGIASRVVGVAILLILVSLVSTCGVGPTPSPVSTLPPAETAAVTPQATATPLPTLTPLPLAPEGRGVIILSLDGARVDMVEGFMADGTMPNLAKLVQRGVKAEYLQTIDPSVTAAAYASLGSGSYPDKTGIVANTFRVPGKYIYQTASGFETAMSPSAGLRTGAAEPIWRTAMRNGLRTAAVFWAGADVDLPTQLADYTIAFGESDAYSNLHTLTFEEAQGWTNTPQSFSPLKEAALTITKGDAPLATVNLLAVDSSDDEAENYDRFILDLDKEIGEESATLSEEQWAPLVIDPLIKSGAYFKITNPSLEEFTIFQSRVNYNQITPMELARDIIGRFGFFPPSPDYYALEHGWITSQDYMTMMETQSRWMMDMAIYVYNKYRPDLMLTWQGPLDEAGHQFLMVDERQYNYSPELAAEYAEYYRQAHKLVDDNLADLLEAIDLSQTTVLIVSDHGMAPIHSYVNVNKVLIDEGLMVLEDTERYYIDVGKTKANAVTSGGAVHVYINLAGREAGGIVPQEQYEEVQEEIIAILSDLADPQTGEPVFPRIFRRQELDELHLASENAGDVFAQARPGFYPDYHRDRTETFEPLQFYGQHGYDSTLPEMWGIFIAAGAGIGQGVTIGPVRAVDVAPTTAWLLGFEPADSVDGEVIEEALE
ncbi:MAG: alkaline phosphatase family protein [Anaerolineae bacterium]